MEVIERARRHHELTPVLRPWIEPFNLGYDGEYFRLILGLDGPLDLRRIDEMT